MLTMKTAPTPGGEIIDSREVIEAIEELEGERCIEPGLLLGDGSLTWRCSLCGVSTTAQGPFGWDGEPDDDWLADQLDAHECDPDAGDGEGDGEYADLRALASEGESLADWPYGETLILESYFVTYAEQLAEEIGAIPSDAAWPCTRIDWEAAAADLRVDYTSLTFGGETYLARS